MLESCSTNSGRVMISRRTLICKTLSILSFACLVSPQFVFASEDDERIPVNPNPEHIVNGPLKASKSKVSYSSILNRLGYASDAVSIANAIAKCIGFPILASFMIDFVNDNIGWLLMNIKGASTKNGVIVSYNYYDRYYLNPATGHKEFYERCWGFTSMTRY